MNTTPTSYTPLETLLLFRGIAQYGLEAAAFASIAEALQNNHLVKDAPTYDIRRLSADALQELFLRLLWEELKSENESAPLVDGAPPPPKKLKTQPTPPPTLRDARQHVEKIESAHRKVHDAYIRHACKEIEQYERQYDRLHGEIEELERSVGRGEVDGEVDGESGPRSPNGVRDAAGKRDSGLVNGVGPSPRASPKPAPQIPALQSVPQPLRQLQPLLPHPAPRQDPRNGNGLSPSQQAVGPERASPAPRSPALPFPQAVRSPQLGQQDVSRVPGVGFSGTPKPLEGAPQVLQAPASAPPAAAEGMRRPDSVGARQSPVSPAAAPLPAQGQLKWEPPYQPGVPASRQTATVASQHQSPSVLTPVPHVLPSQRAPHQQASPHPLPLQPQPGRPLPHQLLISPQSTSQFAPPLQSAPVRPSPDSSSGQMPGRQQPLLPNSAGGSAARPHSPYQPPPYQGYPLSTPTHISQAHSPQFTSGHASPIHPNTDRSQVVPPTTGPPSTAPSRPSNGLAIPAQQRPQPPNLQAPPPYSQQAAPPAAHSLASTHPDAPRTYNSPYQQPQAAAADRLHLRLPAAATPTPPARFSPAPPAPFTPAMTLPQRIAKGSGTAWKSTSTPSTPKHGFELRLGDDDVPSPAFEPASPVLASSTSLSQGADRSMAEQPTGTPDTKRKPGRPRATGGTRDSGAPAAGSDPQTEEVAQAAVESQLPRVKDEVMTPRPSTETGDTTADESAAGRPQPPRSTKRKREDLSPSPVHIPRASQPRDGLSEGPVSTEAPKVVLWTRSFNKVSGSAMEQIIHHRSANMFAAPIREKDAPGYQKVVKVPQDLKTIRAAINHGNRAAAQAAAALPEGDPGTSGVWLPRTEDLAPPKSIINSGQLDRELAHMFSNAIMYNPDPYHGPGPAFLRRDADPDDPQDGAAHQEKDSAGGALGYKVDEFGVVNDARAMFVEVEKLLSELRSAEIHQRRAAPPAAGFATGTSTRQASVLPGGGGGHGGAESVKDEGGGGGGGDDGDEQTGTETDTVGGGGAGRRRRVRS